jgi:hypothetical protein
MPTEGETPKKNKPRVRKTNGPVKSVNPVKPVTTAPFVQKQIDDVIEQALTRFYEASRGKQSKIHDLQHLDTIVAEYLQTFMILGYDINGEKICISHASTPAARDSLIEHLRTTFLSIMNGGE